MRLFLLTLAFSFFGLSAPAFAVGPFGMDVGVTTFEQVDTKYNFKQTDISTWTGGPIYESYSSEAFGVTGLKSVMLITDEDNVILGVILTLAKDKFDDLNASANQQYKLVKETLPFFGTRTASYVADDVEIELSSVHISFVMEMGFTHVDLMNSIRAQVAASKAQEKAFEDAAIFGE